MTEEDSPEIGKSWILLNDEEEKRETKDEASECREKLNDVHSDSDTESISIISDSGSSYHSKNEEEEEIESKILDSLLNQTNEDINENQIETISGRDIVEYNNSQTHLVTINRTENNSSTNIFYYLLVSVLFLISAMLLDNYINKISSSELPTDNDFISVNNIPTPLNNEKISTVEDNIDSSKIRGHKKNLFDGVDYNILEAKLKAKEEYLSEKEKILIEKEHKILEREMKLNSNKDTIIENNYNEQRQRNKKHKEHYKNPKVYKEENQKEKSGNEEQKQQKLKYKRKITKKEKNNDTGQWYFNLNRGRDFIRKQQDEYERLFEKSRIKTLKRHKSNWYFLWMVNREKLRHK